MKVGEPVYEAMLDLVCQEGLERTSVEEVLERAGVAREDFERRFGSMEACALEVFDAFFTDYQDAVREAYESEAQWPDSLRAAAYAVADWIRAHPREVRFGTVEMLWAGDVFQARREAGFHYFAELVDGGREVAVDPEAIPATAAEGVIGSIAEIMTKGLQRGPFDMYDFVQELMYVAVLPYLGEEAAARELTIIPPRLESDGN